MKRVTAILLHDRPVLIGATGTAWTVMLDNIHTAIGIAVGLATVTYLAIKIRKEMKEK